MNLTLKRLSRFCAWLTVLYPYDFRNEFAREMQAVFQIQLMNEIREGFQKNS